MFGRAWRFIKTSIWFNLMIHFDINNDTNAINASQTRTRDDERINTNRTVAWWAVSGLTYVD